MTKHTHKNINAKARAVVAKKTAAKPKVFASGAIRDSDGKTRWDLLPYDALDEIAKVLTDGANQYGDRNWEKGFPWTAVFASLMRHTSAWMLGEDICPKSGRPHLAHAGCNVLFLLTFYLRKTGTDDRVKVK
jgi:Domain of unknown function (DUF5664)